MLLKPRSVKRSRILLEVSLMLMYGRVYVLWFVTWKCKNVMHCKGLPSVISRPDTNSRRTGLWSFSNMLYIVSTERTHIKHMGYVSCSTRELEKEKGKKHDNERNVIIFWFVSPGDAIGINVPCPWIGPRNWEISCVVLPVFHLRNK
jgi:hypothetical protein